MSKKQFKDIIDNNIRILNIDIGDWEQMMANWSTWKKMIYESYNVFEVWRIKYSSLKQSLWKQNLTLYSLNVFVIFIAVSFWNQACLLYEISQQQTIEDLFYKSSLTVMYR